MRLGTEEFNQFFKRFSTMAELVFFSPAHLGESEAFSLWNKNRIISKT